MIYSSSIIKNGKLCRSEYNNIVFDNIRTIDRKGLSSTFRKCTGITSVSFPELTSIGQYGLTDVFYGCTGITSVSFPKLTSIGYDGLNGTFSGCTGITEIHFRSDAQSTVEAASGYSSNFGASNATIYFDL